jgi:hypothetical protein
MNSIATFYRQNNFSGDCAFHSQWEEGKRAISTSNLNC